MRDRFVGFAGLVGSAVVGPLEMEWELDVAGCRATRLLICRGGL